MKKILYVVFCFVGCSINAMTEPLDNRDSIRKRMTDLEMGGYESAQQEDDELLAPEQVTALIYEKKQIEDHYEQAHLVLMVQELHDRDGQRYNKLIRELIPRRGQVEEHKTEEVDKLYAGLMLIKESVNKTNELIQQQIDGGEEQDAIDTRRWRWDFASNCFFGIGGLILGVLGTTIVTVSLPHS
jgi:hypothetical protein